MLALELILRLDLNMAFCCYSVFITIVALLYIFFDVSYFLRTLFTVAWARLVQKKKKVNETTEIYGICTTNDLDIMLKHMNNARFTRELDFARFHFFDITGLYDIITKAKGHCFQTATNIRYRRTIPLFSAYKITTKLIYWDEKESYLEQQFITLNDGFVRAVVLSKQSTVGVNMAEVLGKILGKDSAYREHMSEELKDWISSMDKSSARLRKKN